eukprot:COSAG06_NODE_18875_length_864_cov_0.952941_2_plen_29_part_01
MTARHLDARWLSWAAVGRGKMAGLEVEGG